MLYVLAWIYDCFSLVVISPFRSRSSPTRPPRFSSPPKYSCAPMFYSTDWCAFRPFSYTYCVYCTYISLFFSSYFVSFILFTFIFLSFFVFFVFSLFCFFLRFVFVSSNDFAFLPFFFYFVFFSFLLLFFHSAEGSLDVGSHVALWRFISSLCSLNGWRHSEGAKQRHFTQ